MTSVPSSAQLLLPLSQEKFCTRCEVTQPLEAFSLALRRKGQRATWCKSCQSDYRRNHQPPRRRQTDPEARERDKQQQRERYARKKAGLPPNPRPITTEVYNPPPDKMPIPRWLYQRRRWLMTTYGLTLEDYEAMWTAQGGVCAICKQAETRKHPKGGLWLLSVDHCHTTGRIRALLCEACNNGLGKFRDNPDYLDTAAAYLRQFSE